MFHFVYKTINTINGKFYYGVHSTEDLQDGYLGSGKNLVRAIRKYGSDLFVRHIICLFDDRIQALKLEKDLLIPELLTSYECYNIVEGGGNPPSRAGVVNPSNKLRGDHRTSAQKLASQKRSEQMKGSIPHNRKQITLFGETFPSISQALKHMKLSRSHYSFLLSNPEQIFNSPEELRKASWLERNNKISKSRSS